MTDNVIDFRAWAQARSRRRHPSMWIPDAPASHLNDRSPAALWRADFEVHADQHATVSTSGMWVIAPVVDEALRSSLPIFQLGETGTGRHLLDTACGVVSEDHLQALRLFIIESQEHARLLALVCTAIDAEMIDDHWTEKLFRTTRYLRGFRMEMLAIVIASIVSAEMYETLVRGVGDPALSRIFSRIQVDELRHLEFHSATLPDHIDRWSTARQRTIRALWLTASAVAAVAVAWEHRRLFRACGSSPRAFLTSTVRASAAQASRLFATTN
jgi:hypothetical protein